MRLQTWLFLAVLVFAGAAAWAIFSRLSSDAVSLALGVIFGVLAGVPTALLVMASNRRQEPPQQAPQYQPPVIVITGGDHQALPQDRQHYFVPRQADDFYDVRPEYSTEIVRRRRGRS